MHIEEVRLPGSLREKIRREDQGVRAETCGVEEELDEEFVGCFRDDPADPWAEVVHFADAAVHFAAVVCAVALPVEAGGAEGRPAVEVADEDVFMPEVFDAWMAVVIRFWRRDVGG